MTEQELLQQLEEIQAKLDEIRAGKAAFSVSVSLTEAEKEKQHQEDLQRLRGLRSVISRKTRKEWRPCVRLWKI